MKTITKTLAISISLTSIGFLSIAPFSGIKSLTYFFLLVKYMILTQSFNLVAGYVGYISFGHVAFFGIGGYIAAILVSNVGLKDYYYICLAMGGVGSAAAGYFLGSVLMKLRGAYFAIATLALNEALKVIMFNLPDEFSGGSFGIPLPYIRAPLLGYYLMLIIAIAELIVIYLLVHSKIGVTLKAIREDEDAAMVMGINAPKYKSRAFALSALFMGLAGAVDVQFIGYIYPEAAFNIETNVEVIAMTILGGMGTIIGPILGSVILFIIEDFVWARSPFSHLVILGVILGILVMFMRRGLLGALEDQVTALRGKIK